MRETEAEVRRQIASGEGGREGGREERPQRAIVWQSCAR